MICLRHLFRSTAVAKEAKEREKYVQIERKIEGGVQRMSERDRDQSMVLDLLRTHHLLKKITFVLILQYKV